MIRPNFVTDMTEKMKIAADEAAKREDAADAPLDLFGRHRMKANLMNRVMRALRDCPDDEMRLEMLKELSSMTKLIGALDAAL